jgi:hypothetical protein
VHENVSTRLPVPNICTAGGATVYARVKRTPSVACEASGHAGGEARQKPTHVEIGGRSDDQVRVDAVEQSAVAGQQRAPARDTRAGTTQRGADLRRITFAAVPARARVFEAGGALE